MKLINYALQTQIEYLGENKTNSHFKDYLKSILEDTSKPYYQRADYIGLSMQEIKSKIDTLTSDISDLQSLKKKLSPKSQFSKEKNLLIASNTLVFKSLSLITTSEFFTSLNVACKLVSAFLPNNTLYFTG